MENDITWDKLISATKDPLSLEVAEEFIGCILNNETSRKITLESDVLPKDNEEYDIETGLNEGKTKLIRFIIGKIQENIGDVEITHDIFPDILESKGFNVEKFNISGEEINQLITLTDKQIKDIFIDGNVGNVSPELLNVYNSIHEMTELSGEHTGSTSIFNNKYPDNKYQSRIYLNTPSSEIGINFLTEFAQRCIERGISYEMKGFDKLDNFSGKDRTVLYSYTDFLLEHIEILEEISKEHPEWVEDFGTPIHMGGSPQINSKREWYGIGYSPTNPNNGRTLTKTYNDFIDFSGIIGLGSAICQSLSENVIENLRVQYCETHNQNIAIHDWQNIVDQMKTLSSKSSSIVIDNNSFQMHSEGFSISEINFAHFLIFGNKANINENFDLIFPEGSIERESLVKRFKTQTEKVVSRAQDKDITPIYLSAEMESSYKDEISKTPTYSAGLERNSGFRKPIDIDLGDEKTSYGEEKIETPMPSGGRRSNNSFRRATDMDLDR